MLKYLSLLAAGVLAFSAPASAWAQKEVAPPAVPPMLEGKRPLEQPETKTPSPPASKDEGAKAKVKSKSGKKGQVKTNGGKDDKKKKTTAKAKKKNGKTAKSAKKKATPAPPSAEAVPESL